MKYFLLFFVNFYDIILKDFRKRVNSINHVNKEKLKEMYAACNCNHNDRIVNVLGMYRIGEYIYPDVIKRNLRLSDHETVYNILNRLVEENMAEKVFQYYCPVCGRPDGVFLKEDPEDEVYCTSCDTELDKNAKRYAYKLI